MFLFRRFATAWSAGWHRWCHALLTPAYAGLTLGLGLLAAGLVLPTNGLPVGRVASGGRPRAAEAGAGITHLMRRTATG